MDVVLARIQDFFNFLKGVIESFFGFFGSLLPKDETPEDESK